MTAGNPWDVRAVMVDGRGLLFTGQNHYTGEPFYWHLSDFGLQPEFHASRYTFRRATWLDGSRERFAQMVRRNRRLRGAK
jgi:hypothetical protein